MREPICDFLARYRDHWSRRAENAADPAVREESEAEAYDLDQTLEQFKRLKPNPSTQQSGD